MTSEQLKEVIREGFEYMTQLRTRDSLRFNHGYSNGQIGLCVTAGLLSREDSEALYAECDETYKKMFDKLHH